VAGRDEANRDPLSRAALRQLVVLAGFCFVAFAVLLAVLAWFTSLTATGATTLTAVDAATRTITTTVRTEPPNLDSRRAQDYMSGMVLGHVMEGLLRYDQAGNPAPGIAERWDIGTSKATFWLRAEATWSDGKPVTAHDFVFAWRTALDPATASPYAFILYPVKNGEAINRGDLPKEELGVRAVEDRVLEVELENPIAYFDRLVAWHTYLPIREDFALSRGERYAADAEDLIYNGPFLLTRWVHGANLRFEKNPDYWNADAIKLDVIDIPYITRDAVARLNLFQDGRVADVDYLPGEALDQVLQQRWNLHRYTEASMWMVLPNHRPERATGNFNLRRALQLANDPAELVFKVLKTPSFVVADSLYPVSMKGQRALFREEHPPPRIVPDLEAARRHLELAKQELGVAELPPLVLLSDDTPAALTHSEYLQEYLRRVLGLTVTLDRQNFRQRLAKQQAGEFDLLIFGWSPDYDDPLTFADLFASWNLNNHGRYNGPELDEQVRIAQRSLDQDVRFAAFGEIQRILIEDVVVLPAYERGVLYVQDPRLKGVGRRAVGATPDYTTAYIDEDR
jgi:oligopeptide transport system substrate-binding protein